jgi:hypothetical protein
MLNGNMCVGVHKKSLFIRIGVAQAERLFSGPHVRPMDLTGKVMKGWAEVLPESLSSCSALTDRIGSNRLH